MPMLFTVSLKTVRFQARHGVFPQERCVGNEFIVDLQVSYPAPGNNTDDIADTISYADLYTIVAGEMNEPSDLLEHVARRIVEAVRQSCPLATSIRISIEKVRPPIAGMAGNAAVCLDWSV